MSTKNNQQEKWIRELFLLFYLGFFAVSFFKHLLPGIHALTILSKGAEAICAPGMIFAAGCLMGMAKIADSDFQKKTLNKALFSLLCFYFIGFSTEVVLKHRAIFATIKDLLAMLRIPNICGIFLTLSVLFLICAFFWNSIEKCLDKPVILILACLVGFLCTFIPEGIFGYAPVGVLIGGDRLACIPIAFYLFVFFTGVALGKGKIQSLTGKKMMIGTAAALILGVIFVALGQKTAGLVLLGSGCVWFCLIVSRFLLPLYSKCEELALNLWEKLLIFCTSINKKRETNRKLEIFLYYMGYTILFFIVACFIFVPYVESHKTLIWSVDGLGQYVPKIYRFMSYVPSILSDLLHGNLDFAQYDFTSGLGSTVAISYDPIYWLYLFFKPSQIEAVYSLTIVLRFYLAGASISALLLYFKKSPYVTYTASMVYAFSGYALYAGTRHGQFLTPLILLPVMVIAMEQLITKRKWYLMTIMTALSLLCSYYFLYMNTIALGIYFVARILCTKEYRNFKTFFTRGLIIVGSYILGASIGIISIFTSFGSYMGSSRSGGSKLSSILTTTPLFYRPEWISDSFISFISDSFTPGLWLKLGFAPIALLAIVLLFTRKNKKELKPIFILFTLFCFFPIFGFIFSGFSSVNNRWCYIYALIVAFVLAENMEHMTKLTAREIKIMLGITGLYAGIIFFSTKYRTDKVFGVFGLLMLTMVVILVLNYENMKIPKQIGKIALFGVTIFSIVLNANLFITAKSDTGSHLDTYVDFGKSLSSMSNTALKYLDEVTDGNEEDGFYRSTNLKTFGNARSSSLIYGYNDISTFTSTLNGGIVNYNRAMGNCDWNIVSIYSYNFRTYMHELASVRYLGADSTVKAPLPYGYKKVYEKENKKKTYSIYENEYALPLGYTYSSVMSEAEAENYSAAEKQELTMLTAIVDEDSLQDNEKIGITSADQLPLTAKSLEITDMKLKGVTMDKDTLTVDGAGSSITFTFKGEPNAETYLSLKGDIEAPKDAAEHFLKTRVKTDDVSYLYKFRVDSYSTGQEEFLFNLGYHEDGINTCTLKFLSDGVLKFEDISIYSQSMDTYADRVGALQENVLENVKTEKNTVTGDITLDEDKMLVITLPYQSGWTAWVDGEKVELQQVNYQYMGLNLKAGNHTIRLHYQLPGLKLAFLITGGGIGVFILIIIFNTVRKRKQRVSHKS